MELMQQWDFFLHVLGASLLGGLVGLERDLAGKPAGLRPHTLVAGAACYLVLLGDVVLSTYTPESLIASDPIKIIQAIVVGVSFIGAGTIFRNQSSDEADIEGLTTGASLLSVTATGISFALRLYWLTIGVVIANIIINRGLDDLSVWLHGRQKPKDD